jgi:hypothetical protein
MTGESLPRPIIVEESHGRWSAYFQGLPEFAFGGNRPVVAVERLCQAHGLDVSILACHRSTATPTRLGFVQGRRMCQDCNGSGRFGGLNSADDCRTCYGTGRVE